MRQNQVRPADGAGQFQQISDLPMGCRLPRCGELGWITHHPQDVELAQIVNVQSDAVEYLAVVHVLQGWPHWVWVIWLHLPVLRKVADHGVSGDSARNVFCDLLVPPESKFVSKCRACCQALSRRASSVGCSSLGDDSSDSLEGVSSLGLGWHHFSQAGWTFSS